MGEKIELLITGNASGLVTELQRAGVKMREFGQASQTSSKGTSSFGSEVKGLAGELGLLIGLGAAVSLIKDFGVASIQSAAQAERLGRATDAMAKSIGASGNDIVSAITQASQGTISRLDAMQAANKAMMFGLVENGQQMSDLTQIAVTLGAAMGQSAGKSMDDLTTALGRQSPLILDNLGITLKLEEAYRIYAAQLGKTAESLTEQEKKQAFVAAALEKGREKVAQLGGVTVDSAAKTEQLTAAWSDFQVAFGGLLTAMSGGVEGLTSLVRSLEQGAKAWDGIIQNTSAFKGALDGLQVSISPTMEDVSTLGQAGGDWFGAPIRAVGTFSTSLSEGKGFIDSYRKGWEQILNPLGQGAIAIAHIVTEQKKLSGSTATAVTAEERLNNSVKSAVGTYGATSGATQALIGKQLELSRAANAAALAFGGQVSAMTRSSQLALATAKSTTAATSAAAGAFGGQQDSFSQDLSLSKIQAAGDARLAYQQEQIQLQKEQEQAAQTAADAMSSAFDSAASDMKSTIESVLKPSLDEVWKPPEDTTRMDEGARRMATVATSGFGSEWLAQLNTQFAGQDFFKPVSDAMASGDEGALKEAATNILTNSVSQLWDPEVVKAKVREQLAQANMRDEFIKKIQEDLSAEGVQVDTGQIAVASGDMSQASGDLEKVGQTATEQLPAATGAVNDLKGALDTARESLTGFTNDLGTKIKTAGDKVVGFGTTVKTADWPGTGKAIVQGMAQGIDKNKHLVLEKLKSLAKDAIQSAKDELGIASPSAVFADLTAEIPAGAALGVEQNAGQFDNAIKSLFNVKNFTSVNSIIGMARDQVEKYFDTQDITRDKSKMILSQMSAVFRENSAQILSATDKVKAFKDAARAAGAAQGFEGDQGKIVSQAFYKFIRAYEQMKPLAEQMKIDDAIKKMGSLGSLAGNFNTFATATGEKIVDTLEAQLKFTNDKGKESSIQQQVSGVENSLATIASQQDQLKAMQGQAGRLEFARNNNLDPAAVAAMSSGDFQYLQQQLAFQSALKKSGLGQFAGQFGLGSGLFDMFGAASGGIGSLVGQYGSLLGGLAPGQVQAGKEIHFHLNVSAMDSAGVIQDFGMMQAMAGA